MFRAICIREEKQMEIDLTARGKCKSEIILSQ